MLKALELYGFKSFADKTRFEFPPGITVIVGPNGSGKSNIVDCLKWVLGEQSAKSLRGKEMADVIFKGSGAGGRKPMNTAEATLIFDNAERRLPVDAPEVHITRRVYRSGEGEYLINRQPARLKDIRDLFRGTGVGVDAYSLIEQGKVDRLLNASAKDRRAIFEEAAGISRFKAKKVEAQRRLERVEQNLLRLSDIVEEVENRLKTVRAQAGKARRYREYTERLQQLRTQIAQVDWRRLTERLQQAEQQLTECAEASRQAAAEQERLEREQAESEAAAAEAGGELRQLEGALAALRQELAAGQAAIAHERRRGQEFEEQVKLHLRNLLAMNDKAGDVVARWRKAQEEVAAAHETQQAASQELARRQDAFEEQARTYEAARQRATELRQQHLAQIQAVAALSSQVESVQSRLDALRRASGPLEARRSALDAAEAEAAAQLQAAAQEEQALAAQLAEQEQRLEEARRELAEYRNLYASRAEDLAQLHGRLREVAERERVLDEFERTLEGVGAGVKQVLSRARAAGGGTEFTVQSSKFRIQNSQLRVQGSRFTVQGSEFEVQSSAEEQESAAASFANDDSPVPRHHAPPTIASDADPLALVRGVVADFVQVAVEHAAAIDAALGELAQAVVVEGGRAEQAALLRAAGELPGRVAVLALEASTALAATPPEADGRPRHASGPAPAASIVLLPQPAGRTVELSAEMVSGIHVLARADKLVECPEEYRPLVTKLLGSTFVVRTLEDAWRLHERAPRGTRLVTSGGELLDAQGAIHFGPTQSATSLVSRRSQLRAARLGLAVLEQQIADAQREAQHLRNEVERQEQAVGRLAEEAAQLHQGLAARQAAAQALAKRKAEFAPQRAAAEAAIAENAAACEAASGELATRSQELAAARAVAASGGEATTEAEQALAQAEQRRQRAAEELTAAKVELARWQQRLESLRFRLTQFEDDRRERERASDQVRQQLEQARRRQEAAELAILAASDGLAHAALRKQAIESRVRECTARQEAAAAARVQRQGALQACRKRVLSLRDKEHALALAAEQIRHERKTLADRLRDDYAIELADLEAAATEENPESRRAVEEEIESLRRKINQIGAVNLDALEELDELEQRFATLAAQHKDLIDAKQALEKIIHRINADSRRLFLETLEAIRLNFQALYRKAFGGGKADIVLEEGVDVLECGVEIIATPPGKPSFNNSLLSGGEKALTAVALLLAIFQFRPSPFCVLDEVDAPFDEANIGRFIEVLRDFLSWTRFVIVTHSKKTMTAATTLYGVTMQESGVSKRVSVRFEDVSDDGQIRREALDRAAEEAAENAA